VSSSPPFVLIPGAGTDPRVYRATAEALSGLGHVAITPELPLDDAEATPSDHADAVDAAVPGGREVLVVAHSLGAFAGSLVPTRVSVAKLVLLAPMIPAPGESAGEWWENTRHADAIAELLDRLGPMSAWDPEALAEVFLHDVDPEVALANAHFNGAPGAGMFREPWPLERWPEVPTSVLAPREDRLFPPAFQRHVARERLGLDVDELPGGHLPMLSRPPELAQRLVEVTRP
jgi:pimeloyl-ACP methyl ester carboxylesterase